MKRGLLIIAICILSTLSFPLSSYAQLEEYLPFVEPEIDTYFKKTSLLYPIGYDASYQEILSSYVFGHQIIGIVEKPDGDILRFQSIEEPTWEPEPDTDLFFSNYEFQVVGFMTVANRLCVVINLYNKNTGQLVWKYAMDAETKLIL